MGQTARYTSSDGPLPSEGREGGGPPAAAPQRRPPDALPPPSTGFDDLQMVGGRPPSAGPRYPIVAFDPVAARNQLRYAGHGLSVAPPALDVPVVYQPPLRSLTGRWTGGRTVALQQNVGGVRG